jgi:signal transduction histidine kinase
VTYSLRRTLAVRFALTMALGLAATAGAICWGTGTVLRRELDQGLAAAAFLSEQEMSQAEPRVPDPLKSGDPSEYGKTVNRYVVLRDGDGAVLHAMPDISATLPFDARALEAARKGARIWKSERWRSEHIRSLYHPLRHEGLEGDAVLQVSASLTPLRQVQRDLLVALLAVVLVGTAATFAGAWHLARSATQPVAEITGQATRIEVGTLGQRIVAHADAEEYRGLVAVLNRMLERLDRAFRTQQRLTADVSHELRTPLTAMRGEIEVALRSERSPAGYRQVLHSALEEIDRMSAMTEDLLLITRADGHLLEAQRVPTELNALVRATVEEFERGEGPDGPDFRLELAAEVDELPLDAGLMRRLLLQMLENAAKFAPPPGCVTVSTARAPGGRGGAVVAIQDSGPGIAPRDLPHIFEPFYRADQARTSGTGLGLGLSVAAAIARLHGATLTAANGPSGGARFELVIPGGVDSPTGGADEPTRVPPRTAAA